MSLLDVPGASLNFRITGNGAPVLFIKGVGVAGSGWRPQVDEPSRDFRCLSAPDRVRSLASDIAIPMLQRNAMRRYNRSAQLAELGTIPTLVASSAEDPIALSDYGRSLHASIPNSRYRELARFSHGMTLQAPSHINAVLRNHFQEAAAVSRRARGARA